MIVPVKTSQPFLLKNVRKGMKNPFILSNRAECLMNNFIFRISPAATINLVLKN